MPLNPQEDVLKRLQGIKDPRGLMGEMARGTNMYPGGDAARTGGGPGIGRPPEAPGEPSRVIPPNALAALQQRTGMAIPQLKPAAPPRNQNASGIAKAALQAAAQRRLQRK